jgi:hypothetical protein
MTSHQKLTKRPLREAVDTVDAHRRADTVTQAIQTFEDRYNEFLVQANEWVSKL